MQCNRLFSTFKTPLLREWRLVTTRRVARTPVYQVGDEKPVKIPNTRPPYPVYKYGPSNIFKQSNYGLYGGQFIQFGNSISESKKKMRRFWKLNIIKKKCWSETLNKFISIKMTSKVYRTLTKEGGIDPYLVKSKSARIKELGPTGWKLRFLILKHKNWQETTGKSHVIEQDENNNSIYHLASINDKEYKITCGKRKLLKHLYPLELTNNESLTFSAFNMEHSKLEVDDILQKLENHGFNLSSISV